MGNVKDFFNSVKYIFIAKKELKGRQKVVEMDKANQKLKEYTDSMTSKHCPIHNNNCIVNCIHFEKGSIWNYDGSLRVVRPWCRLWD